MPTLCLERDIVSGAHLSARAAGMVACTDCGHVWPMGKNRCGKCGASLVSRPPRGLEQVWAWWIAGVLLYIPANIYPMLITRTFGREEESTILGGVIELVDHGSWGIAAIVFIASIVIPIAKFAAIATLSLAIRHPGLISAHKIKHVYEAVEVIGRWSMIDIFVIGILSALVQLGFLASLNPGPAAACFALSVAFTMLAARAFDTRVYWDALEHEE